jgi:hypothetical protein
MLMLTWMLMLVLTVVVHDYDEFQRPMILQISDAVSTTTNVDENIDNHDDEHSIMSLAATAATTSSRASWLLWRSSCMKRNTSFVFLACMYLCVVVMIVLEEIIVERVRILGLPLGRVGVSFLSDSFVGLTFHTSVAFSSCSAVVATSDEC